MDSNYGNKMKHKIAILILAMQSCSPGRPTEQHSKPKTTNPDQAENTSAPGSLTYFTKRIKGNWVTEGESIGLQFTDHICIMANDDTVQYSISYTSCETGKIPVENEDRLVYLKLINSDKEESCYSVENITDSSLALMSLGNGSMWLLKRNNYINH
jgi:hypothetical protein